MCVAVEEVGSLGDGVQVCVENVLHFTCSHCRKT